MHDNVCIFFLLALQLGDFTYNINDLVSGDICDPLGIFQYVGWEFIFPSLIGLFSSTQGYDSLFVRLYFLTSSCRYIVYVFMRIGMCNPFLYGNSECIYLE